nr:MULTISPECIES: AMP-binding protein [unclassified Nocardia]
MKARPDATGRWSINNAEVRLVDLDGNDVAVGETGEMIVRGETIMKAYWNKPDATAERCAMAGCTAAISRSQTPTATSQSSTDSRT